MSKAFFGLLLFFFSASSWALQSPTELKAELLRQVSLRHHSIGYDNARKLLMGQLHLKSSSSGYSVQDVYCLKEFSGRDFSSRPPGPDQIPKETILNTEHTWPQSRFSGKAPKDIQKSDLHHLFPTDSEMNSIRGSNKFGEIFDNGKKIKCQTSRYGKNEDGQWIFDPPKEHRGNVARALFYFSVRYQIAIEPSEEAFLRKWNIDDPVDSFEVERNTAIEKVQGNRNPFIDHPDLVDQIDDF